MYEYVIENDLVRFTNDYKILKYYNSKKEYLEAPLINNSRGGRYKTITVEEPGGKQYALYVHRLLAIKFIPNPEGKPQVNHIDGNPSNNSIDNLEWATAKENVNHAIVNGLRDYMHNTCVICKEPTQLHVCRKCSYELAKSQKSNMKRQSLLDEFSNVQILKLPEMELDILTSRFDGQTLEEIAQKYNCTREWIRVILKKIKAGKRYKKEYVKQRKKIPKSLKKSKYKKLVAEILEQEISIEELTNDLNIGEATLYKKFEGKSDWTVNQIITIKESLKTDLSIEELLEEAI